MALEDRRQWFTWRNHRKRKRLRRKLGADAVLAIEDLWDVVAQNPDMRRDGVLRGMTPEDIAAEVDYPGDPDELVKVLLDVRLLDRLESDELAVHDWEDWQEFIVQYDDFCEEMREKGKRGGKRSAERHAKRPAKQPADRAGQPPDQTRPDRPDREHTRANAPPLSPSPEEILEKYQISCVPAGMPKVQRLTDKRRRHIRARLKLLPKLTDWCRLFNRASQSSFLTGKQKKWRADLDWLVKNENNPTRVLEGAYDDRDPAPGGERLGWQTE